MKRVAGRLFREVWVVDFEFCASEGERPSPICVVGWELNTGRKLRLWQEQLIKLHSAPYPTDRDCLIVAYYGSAEMGCHLALGWPMPTNLLDLYVEFRNQTNGRPTLCGNGLLGALAWFGLPAIEAAQKDSMRSLALRGGPWNSEEQTALLEYCESDVSALSHLLPAMEPDLDIERALLRGRYMSTAAHIERLGVPIDVPMLTRLRENWTTIQDQLIAEIDEAYGIYDGRTFKSERFAQWLARSNIAWPQLASGALDLSDETFREMSRTYPGVAPLRELRVSLSQMRLSELTVGGDGRNRALLSPFRAKTSRNQPSNKHFIFGPSVWLRGLIRPEPGCGLAYIDWSQQEFGIAAALSGDPRMQAAYRSGDPYLEFAKQAGAVPKDGTKASHKAQREQFKACALAMQYGMGAEALAIRINQPVIAARNLLRLHRETYRLFWAWSDAAVNYAMLHGYLFTAFGWTIHVGGEVTERSLRNFPMQANGAEMLRWACCLAVEGGIRVLAPVHDAILIEAPLAELDETVQRTQAFMARASEIVLDGFALRSDARLVRYPERYQDERGVTMWETVAGLLQTMPIGLT